MMIIANSKPCEIGVVGAGAGGMLTIGAGTTMSGILTIGAGAGGITTGGAAGSADSPGWAKTCPATTPISKTVGQKA